MAQPGVMLYFDILEPIKVLPNEDKGRLLVAILEYGKLGIVPEFDGMLALAWGFVRPKIDRDREEYNRSVLRRQYATACRERKKKNEPEITFDEWVKTLGIGDYQSASLDTNDNQWYPTTTAATPTSTPITPSTSTSTSTTTKTDTSTAAAAAGTTNADGDMNTATAADKKLKYFNGELGKGVVVLSEYQVDVLLEKLGIEMFDHYVTKLADFIIKNGATVKSHYSTILKWWTEDSIV